jgi:hypothetical protein
MKQILLVFVFLAAINMAAFAQINNIVATSDSAVVLSNIYVGLLNSVAVDSDLKAQPSSSFRLGSDMFWQMSPWAKVKSRIIYCRIDNKDMLISFFSLKLHSKGEKIGLEFGHMPTLATEMMPHPLSPGGQFMSWTEWQMTGPAVGAKATFKTGVGLFGLGVAQRNDKPEYHFKWEKGALSASACSDMNGKYFQSALSFKPSYIYTVTVFRHDVRGDLLANYTNVPIGHQLAVCVDAGYYLNQSQPEKLEFGIIKDFSTKLLKGIFYFYYTQENHCLNAALLLSI